MKNYLFLTLFLILLIFIGCDEEREKVSLLVIGDIKYEVDDFVDYLKNSRPSMESPYDPVVLDQYLQEFVEHKVLYHAAIDNQMVPPPGTTKFEQELSMIGRYLYQEAYIDLSIDPDKVREEYEKQYQEPRVRIKSIFFNDQRTAQRVFANVRRRPRDFDSLMARYNPEEVVNTNMGQGVFTRFQLPERIRDEVFAENEPKIVGPVDMDVGYLVIQIVEFLDRPSLDEVKFTIEEQLAAQQRYQLRANLVEKLKEKYSVKVNKEELRKRKGLVAEAN